MLDIEGVSEVALSYILPTNIALDINEKGVKKE
jgi:hypothetical protein